MSDTASNNLHQHRVLRNAPHPSEPSQEFEAEEYILQQHQPEFDESFRPRRNLRKEFPLADPSPALAGPGVRPKRGNSNTQLLASPSTQGAETEEKVYRGTPVRSGSSRRDSTQSAGSNSKDRKKKDKQMARERKNKIDALDGKIEAGHIDDDNGDGQSFVTTADTASTTFQSISFVEQSVKEQSSSVPLFSPVMEKIYDSSVAGVNASRNGSADSLIFPTRTAGADANQQAELVKKREIARRLNECEERSAKRFVLPLMGKCPKLDLSGLSMSSEDDIPVKDLCNTALGNVLQKLLLRKNKLKSIPPSIVQCLPALTVLDLQQCSLHELPETWNLPKLKTLDVSCNHLTDFPGESMLRGLPELTNLLLKDNEISDITLPSDPKLLSKLKKLDLGYNRITLLQDELDELSSLSHLLLEHNFFTQVPMRVCLMKSLRELNVRNNESIHQPPTHDCERGLCAMRRYWECLRREEESKREVEANLRKRASKAAFAKSSSLPPKLSFNESQLSETQASMTERYSTGSTVSAWSIATPKPAPKSPLSGRSQSSPIPNLITTPPTAQDTINDTLKVIVVGMEFAGKTSLIKKLIEGRTAEIPGPDKRTVGLDIYDWYPKTDKRFEDIDSRIETMECVECGAVDVKFSVWDFAGQHVYHATHELFFSRHALYIIVWDMGHSNQDTYVEAPSKTRESGAFALDDSSDEESDDDTAPPYTDANRQADLALAADIDEKVQFWVDCIQNTSPGAVILPVASFADSFTTAEANRRCKIMQERLLRHEEQRVKGIRDRLQELKENYRLNDVAANHLRHLQCPANRPKLIFGTSTEAVVKVSCTEYCGFEKLTRRVIDVATGRNKFGSDNGLFCGHVGARIPRMRLDVRERVRTMRKKFRVVEWGYFTSVLLEQGQTSKDDIVDALLFLSSTGELSFFGSSHEMRYTESTRKSSDSDEWPSSELEEEIALSLDTTTISTRMTSDETASTFDDFFPSISQFVFLNPRWLVAAVACVMRHDLDVRIRECRRDAEKGITTPVPRTANPHTDGHINCPVITEEDACLLWRHDHTTNKAAERAMEYSNNESVSPFDFLQTLLTRFGVFVPINLDIDMLLFGGMKCSDFSRDVIAGVGDIHVGEENEVKSKATFFLPCLLGPAEPGDVWTYKTSDSWKTTLCHSLLFPDGVPTGLMERLTSTVLSVIHTLAERPGAGVSISETPGSKKCTFEGKLKAKEILCWQNAFYLKLGSQVQQSDGTEKESVIEIFVTLAKPDSPLCVGSQHMVRGMRRLIITGRGPAGDGGRKIWTGGYVLVLKCVQRVITEYGGAEYEKHGFCPKCLSELDVKKASFWKLPRIRAAVSDREEEIHCQYGHVVETRLVAGPNDSLRPSRSLVGSQTAVKVDSLLHAVVVVGLLDGRTRDIVRVGSGFIVDKKRGLIVTAAHTLINVWDDKSAPFGEDYYGLSLGRVVIGVVPADEENGVAVFRYFAQIVTKDPNLEQGNCRVDACVLQIVTRLEKDVVGSTQDWRTNQPETLLLNSQKSMKSERLPALKLLNPTSKIEREEQVRIIGYNQGGEGLLGAGASLNRVLDFAIGYYVSTYPWAEDGRSDRTDRFKPKEEMIVMCPTIGGHSGGPCVNLRGEVIGILSRADSAESQRCYLVPSAELKSLVSQAKKLL